MPLPSDPWDLVVIGGGTAGLVGAMTAAGLGARVLLVERERTGGDCLWTGCVPSKALIAAAEAVAAARHASTLGVEVDGVRVDFTAVMRHVRNVIEAIEPTDSSAALERAGVRVLHGAAVFTGRTTIEVDGQVIGFRQALLATGAAPAVPQIRGLATAAYLTSDTIWGLRELPEHLVVLGGGSTACELGQAFARLGSKVTLVEAAARILPYEDSDAAELVAAALVADGVTILCGHAATAVTAGAGASGQVELADGTVVPYGALLVAAGRAPRTAALGLRTAGVDVDERQFVVVDPKLRTTNPRIWAAGDLTGHPQFTHTAGVHAALAAGNAVLGLRRTVTGAVMPRVTFTQPEVAAVGIGAEGDVPGRRVLRWSNEHVDRAVAQGRPAGFTKLVVDQRGRLVGATVVGPRAGEVLAELTLAVTQGLRVRDLASTTHPYPTYGDGPWNAAIADVRASLARPAVHPVVTTLVGARRWWLDRRPVGAAQRL